MKLSTNFTLFGLNVKAIQAYLKEQAKDRRGVRITCRGDLVYIITAYTAFKLPSVLYADVIQPVTFRECPADGVTIISAQYGFEVEENAPDLVDIFKRHAPNEKPVERTPFLQDIHRQKEERPCKAFPHRDNAHLDKCRLRQHGEPGAIHLSRHDARLFPRVRCQRQRSDDLRYHAAHQAHRRG